MDALTEYQLIQMRETQETAYPDKVVVRRIVRTDDGFGGVTTGNAEVVHDDVPCRITPAQTQMMGGQADRPLEIEKWGVRFPVGADIRDKDILTQVSTGLQMQVEDAKNPKSYQTAFTVMAEVVRNVTWKEA